MKIKKNSLKLLLVAIFTLLLASCSGAPGAVEHTAQYIDEKQKQNHIEMKNLIKELMGKKGPTVQVAQSEASTTVEVKKTKKQVEEQKEPKVEVGEKADVKPVEQAEVFIVWNDALINKLVSVEKLDTSGNLKFGHSNGTAAKFRVTRPGDGKVSPNGLIINVAAEKMESFQAKILLNGVELGLKRLDIEDKNFYKVESSKEFFKKGNGNVVEVRVDLPNEKDLEHDLLGTRLFTDPNATKNALASSADTLKFLEEIKSVADNAIKLF